MSAAEPVGLAGAAVAGTVAGSVAGEVHSNRREHERHPVDTSVNLTLVKGATVVSGTILDLSLGGCRLRTNGRFSFGVFARLEAEFFLHGLAFRLSGVTQAIFDANTIALRFLDVSGRRREQLAELIAELAADEAAAAAGH